MPPEQVITGVPTSTSHPKSAVALPAEEHIATAGPAHLAGPITAADELYDPETSLLRNEGLTQRLTAEYAELLTSVSSGQNGPFREGEGQKNMQRFLLMLNASSRHPAREEADPFTYGAPWSAGLWAERTMAHIKDGQSVFSDHVDQNFEEALASARRYNPNCYFVDDREALAHGEQINRDLAALPINGSLTIYGGYNMTRDFTEPEPSFHTMYYRIVKTGEDKYQVYLYNGNLVAHDRDWDHGARNTHSDPSSGAHFERGFPSVRPFVLFEDVHLGNLQNAVLAWQRLLVPGAQGDRYTAAYDVAMRHLGVRPTTGSSRSFPNLFNYATDPARQEKNYENFIKAQRACNCYIKSLNCLALHMMADYPTYKRFTLDNRLLFLTAFFSANREELRTNLVMRGQLQESLENFIRILRKNIAKPNMGLSPEMVKRGYSTAREMLEILATFETQAPTARGGPRIAAITTTPQPLTPASTGVGPVERLMMEILDPTRDNGEISPKKIAATIGFLITGLPAMLLALIISPIFLLFGGDKAWVNGMFWATCIGGGFVGLFLGKAVGLVLPE